MESQDRPPQVFATLFGGSEQCQAWRAVAQASKSLTQVILSAEEMLESLKIFHAQMRDLLPSAGRQRIFRKQPKGVAQALNPLQEWAENSEGTSGCLLELFKSLEPAAKALCGRSVSLAETFQAAGKLQAGLYEMSRALGVAFGTHMARKHPSGLLDQ